MPKLIIQFNNEVIDHIELNQGDMKIGRRASCDVYIDNLAISGEHANVFTIGDDSFIQDLNSTNGTFVNNKKITKHHLQTGDIIAIGKHTFVYYGDNEAAPAQVEASEDFARTVIIDPNSSSPDMSPSAKKTKVLKDTIATHTAESVNDRQGAIFVLSGANSGKRIELTKSITNLGKTGKVSGSIHRAPEGYKLVSGGKSDAPKLNGRALRMSEEAILKNGDIIEVTGTRLQFYLK